MRCRFAGLAVCVIFATVASAGNWPNWRGPGFDGIVREGSGYPTHWSKSENVVWKADLPGKGASTPVVWDNRIILTCAIEGKNGVLCLDLAGQPVWQKTIGKEKAGKHAKATACTPPPTPDGKPLSVSLSTRALAC